MKAYMQRMGRSLMLPVAVLPAASSFIVGGNCKLDRWNGCQ